MGACVVAHGGNPRCARGRRGQQSGVGRAAAGAGESQHTAARAAQCRRAHSHLAAAGTSDERPYICAVGLVRRGTPVGMVMRSLIVVSVAALAVSAMYAQRNPHTEIFTTSDQCLACHNGLRTPAGEDVSIGASWRGSMMANSSRDPYWQAGVRREMIDHPSAATAIQDECATCHMPMSRTEARINGRQGGVFNHLPVADKDDRSDRLAHDGVACSICHQITDQNLGTPMSFSGGYVVSPSTATAASGARQARPMFGPFKIERGMTTIMRSATGFEPTEALHVRQSELCATCHTLTTKAR